MAVRFSNTTILEAVFFFSTIKAAGLGEEMSSAPKNKATEDASRKRKKKPGLLKASMSVHEGATKTAASK